MTQINTIQQHLIFARWILPVEPAGVVLEHHALVIQSERIVDLLPSDIARTRYPNSPSFDLANHVLIPGLINTHTHAAMTLLRGLADDLPLMSWLQDHIWPAEARWVSPEFVKTGTLLAVAEMLRGGVTCFNDMYFFPEETASAAMNAGIRACIGLIILDFPTAWALNAAHYIVRAEEVHERLRHFPLIKTALAPHAPYTVSDGPLAKIQTLSEALDVQVHLHLHETATEIEQSLSIHGTRPINRLKQLGLLSPRLIAVHMTQLTESDITACATHGVHVVHCPESNLKLASGFCPVARLLAAGVNVALGTDGAASNNDLDLLSELRTAALLAKAVAGDAAALPAQKALFMATLAGARALGMDSLIGSLVPGKAADVVAVDLSGLTTEPVYHPASALVYAASHTAVTDVWIAGRHIVQNRVLTTLDLTSILDQTRSWQKRIFGNTMETRQG